MRKLNRAALIAATLTLATGTVTAATVTSAGATDRANHCGSSYHFKKSWPIKSTDSGNPGTKGYIDIYYSPSSGKNCAIARPINGLYNPHGIVVSLYSGSAYDDDGYHSNYKKYAGPVYVSARGKCISFSGGLSFNASWSPSEASGKYTNKHCG